MFYNLEPVSTDFYLKHSNQQSNYVVKHNVAVKRKADVIDEQQSCVKRLRYYDVPDIQYYNNYTYNNQPNMQHKQDLPQRKQLANMSLIEILSLEDCLKHTSDQVAADIQEDYFTDSFISLQQPGPYYYQQPQQQLPSANDKIANELNLPIYMSYQQYEPTLNAH